MININKLNTTSLNITTGPAVKPETHIKFVGGTEGDYLIEGTMDCPALVSEGLMPAGSGTEQPPSWITYPAEVEIGTAVTSFGGSPSVFYNCSELTSVTIPNSVTSIGPGAFNNCSNLTSVIIPDSVTSIGESAFIDCSGLTNVTIGNGVTSIAPAIFEGCSRLTSVTFSGKTISTVQGMANYSWFLPSGCKIHCTDGDITVQY